MNSALFERVLSARGPEFRSIVLEQQGSEFFHRTSIKDVTYGQGTTSLSPVEGDESYRQPPVPTTADDGSIDNRSDGHDGDVSSDKSANNVSILDSKLKQFVARKADLFFQVDISAKEDVQPEEIAKKLDVSEAEKSDYFAILPPLEQFMRVPSKHRKKHLFSVLQIGILSSEK